MASFRRICPSHHPDCRVRHHCDNKSAMKLPVLRHTGVDTCCLVMLLPARALPSQDLVSAGRE